MALDHIPNFSKAQLAGTHTAGTTTINVVSGAKLPAAGPYNAVVWNATDFADPSDDPNVEIVTVTGGFGTAALTVLRGQEGTTATAKSTGGKVYKLLAGLTRAALQTLPQILYSGSNLGTYTSAEITTGSQVLCSYTVPGGTLQPGDELVTTILLRQSGTGANTNARTFFGAIDTPTTSLIQSADAYTVVTQRAFIHASGAGGQSVLYETARAGGTNARVNNTANEDLATPIAVGLESAAALAAGQVFTIERMTVTRYRP